MQVSFGTLYTVKQGPIITEKQRKVENLANNIFLERHESCGTTKPYYSLRNLDDMLEEDMLVDIYVTHKKNGDTTIKLKSIPTDDGYDEEDIRHKEKLAGVVKEKDKIGITLSKTLSFDEIKLKLKDFARDCISLAEFYKDKISDFETEQINEEIRKETPEAVQRRYAREAELRKLGEEEDFIEEFGTDEYN